jgi:hypothetical protein
MLPSKFKGILAPTKDSIFTEPQQKVVPFADPAKRKYPKTDIL